jgi:hypothetical protein
MTDRDKAKLIDNLTEAAAILRWSRYDVPLAGGPVTASVIPE